MKASDAFEQQIQRIYELLADSGAEVTWNENIPDPDNPSQPRQIDVTIRRAGTLTLIECRQHKSRQDVQWIEELIGRRISLGAQAVIAVSSSGFTAGARAKASKHGVILRDLPELSRAC
jgi:HJR/Mrr/RecB family endonuclease